MDIDQKAEWIRQIQKEQEEQERVWCRRGSYERNQQTAEENKSHWLDFFRFRILASVLLFLCLFAMKKGSLEVGGISYRQIVEYIGTNMELEDVAMFLSEEEYNFPAAFH